MTGQSLDLLGVMSVCLDLIIVLFICLVVVKFGWYGLKFEFI